MTVTPEVKFKNWDCFILQGIYPNGRLALRLISKEDHEPIAVATVNVVDDNTAKDEVVIKDYSENQGMYKALLDQNIVHPAHRYTRTGYVMSPVCKLKIKVDGI